MNCDPVLLKKVRSLAAQMPPDSLEHVAATLSTANSANWSSKRLMILNAQANPEFRMLLRDVLDVWESQQKISLEALGAVLATAAWFERERRADQKVSLVW